MTTHRHSALGWFSLTIGITRACFLGLFFGVGGSGKWNPFMILLVSSTGVLCGLTALEEPQGERTGMIGGIINFFFLVTHGLGFFLFEIVGA